MSVKSLYAVLVAALLALFIVHEACAGVIITQTKGPAQLKDPTGKVTQLKDGELSTCVSTAGANYTGDQPQELTCWQSTKIVVKKSCDDVPAPHIALTKDVNGFYPLPDAVAQQVDDNTWTTLSNLYVHAPGWPDAYPNCWVRGMANPDEWRINGADPNNVFMELKVVGMADIDYPLEPDPIVWSPELQAAWSSEASCQLRHHDGIFYPEDTCT